MTDRVRPSRRGRAPHDAARLVDRLTGALDRVIPFRGLRPLDRIPSIKLKLSILIVAAVAVTVVISVVAFLSDLELRYGVLIAVGAALAMVQILARGITFPLREMADAADRMALGDYSQEVTATSADEVGRLGRSFNQMAAHIHELEQQRRDLIANVSHELRTPIAVIQGSIENLLDGVDPDEQATLDAMHRQATRLGRLVDDLLDLSRLEAGQVPLAREPVEVAGVMAQIASETALRQPTPALDIDAPAGLQVFADPERLHQVVANLVDNAIRHGPPNAPVRIEAALDRDTVVIAVSDQGPGIADDRLATIFDRYVGSSTAGSTGLGLAIAKSIVDRHGGTITVSNTDPGCRFDVRLPTAKP